MGKIHVVAVEIKPPLEALVPFGKWKFRILWNSFVRKRNMLQFSLNSRYWGRPRDCGLVSVITRERNNGVSVIAACPQGGSWRNCDCIFYSLKRRNFNLYQVWKVAGNQGDGWYRGSHNFSDLVKNKTAFTVIFEAERGPTAASDIAIDDITFTSCSHSKWHEFFQ